MKIYVHKPGIMFWVTLALLRLNVFDLSGQALCTDPVFNTAESTDKICSSFGPYDYKVYSLPDQIDSSFIHPCISKKSPIFFYKIKIDSDALWIHTMVQSIGNWKPVWAIFAGESCDNLALLYGGKNADVSCSNGDGNDLVHTVKRVPGIDTYFVAISTNDEIDVPEFLFAEWTTADCLSCIGHPGCDTDAKWNIISRSSQKSLNDPTFCQGEEVSLCFEFLYDASETGVDWFHGLIPDFGPGWDMDYFIPQEIEVQPPGADWFDSGDSLCAPKTNEMLRLLCTYTDPRTGNLKVCNTQCQVCPCQAPLTEGSILPSGWFWNRPGGAGCENSCSPSTQYGIGSVVASIKICMKLRVRTFDNTVDLYNNRNLRINFQTTSDGVSGCWQDPAAECMLDYAQIGPDWRINCDTILPPTPLLQLFVFNDEDKDGKYNPLIDSPLNNCAVTLEESDRTYFTNNQGRLFIRADTGVYNFIFKMNYGSWQDSIIKKRIELNEILIRDTVWFTPKFQFPTAQVVMAGTILRCESVAEIDIICKNTSNTGINGYLSFRPDSRVGIIDNVPVPESIGAGEIIWNLINLKAGEIANFTGLIRIPFSMSNNDTLRFRAYLITFEGDTLSEFIYKEIIRCSYDPNDKLTHPERFGIDNYTLRDESLFYTIRFQNTGNDTAFVVRLKDVLDKNIDKTSLDWYGSSHAFEYQIHGDTLWVTFENILLPDSTTNEKESQGYAIFGIDFYKDVPDRTKIYNTGEIYFDSNPPITTNTTVNTIIDRFPCPSTDYSIIDNTLFASGGGLEYKWYDCNTNLLIFESDTNMFTPEKSGIYYVEISDHFCTVKGTCIHFILSSTQEHSKLRYKIFPNPSLGGFSISGLSENTKIELMEINGRTIKSWFHTFGDFFTFPDDTKIPIGLYCIKIVNNTDTAFTKWLKAE